jgi:hypothetical protein
MPARSRVMKKYLIVGLGLCALGALWRWEEKENGAAVAMSPFLAALAIEIGVFLLRRHQTTLLGAGRGEGGAGHPSTSSG